MAESNFKYDMLSKQVMKTSLLSEEMNDYSETYKIRYNKMRSRRTAKVARSDKLSIINGCHTMELNVQNKIVEKLLEEQMEHTEELQRIMDEISVAEEERNELITAYGEAMNNFETKLRSQDDEFSLENLEDELSDLSDTKAIQKNIDFTIKRLQNDKILLEKAMGAIPKYDNLKAIQQKLLGSEHELKEKEEQLATLKKACNQLEAKLQQE